MNIPKLAAVWSEMDNAEQAQFFSALAALSVDWLPAQMANVTRCDELSADGLEAMDVIGRAARMARQDAEMLASTLPD